MVDLFHHLRHIYVVRKDFYLVVLHLKGPFLYILFPPLILPALFSTGLVPVVPPPVLLPILPPPVLILVPSPDLLLVPPLPLLPLSAVPVVIPIVVLVPDFDIVAPLPPLFGFVVVLPRLPPLVAVQIEFVAVVNFLLYELEQGLLSLEEEKEGGLVENPDLRRLHILDHLLGVLVVAADHFDGFSVINLFLPVLIQKLLVGEKLLFVLNFDSAILLSVLF